MNKLRLFIAVVIPDEVKDMLEERVRLLRKKLPSDLKWVKKENWHLTLKFLGETEEDRVPELTGILSSLAAGKKETDLCFRGITAFPRKSYPRVIVTTAVEGAEAVRKLYLELESQLAEQGYQRDNRAFSPHLTLARTRRNTDIQAAARSLEVLNFELEIPLTMNKIALYKSDLQRSGPVYTELASARLQE